MGETEFNAADEEVVHAVTKKQENTRKQEMDDIREVLKTPHGVRYVRRLLADGKIFHSSFTGSSQTFFNEGWRSFALKVMADAGEAAPLKLNELLIEKKEEVKK